MTSCGNVGDKADSQRRATHREEVSAIVADGSSHRKMQRCHCQRVSSEWNLKNLKGTLRIIRLSRAERKLKPPVFLFDFSSQ